MKMNVRVTEVRPLKKQKQEKKPSGRPAGGKGGVRELRVAAAPSEIDVRGLCAEEAILEVDQFISSALMSKLLYRAHHPRQGYWHPARRRFQYDLKR